MSKKMSLKIEIFIFSSYFLSCLKQVLKTSSITIFLLRVIVFGEKNSGDIDISIVGGGGGGCNDSGILTTPPSFFGHLIDEMLVFEARLDGLCYPPQAVRPADLFTLRLDVLQHWISLESEIAHHKLTDLLSKPYAWRVDNR